MELEEAWAALAIGAMLCLGLSDFLNKRAMSSGVKRTQFLLVQSFFFTITTLALLPLVGGLEWSPELLYAIACGVITFFSYLFVLKALETGEASTVVPIYRMSFGVTVVLAIVIIGEDITPRKVLGFALIIVALLVLTAIKERRAEKQTHHSHEGMPVGIDSPLKASVALAAMFATIAMVTIGTKGLLYKVGVSEGAPPATFALVQSLTFLPIAIVYTYYADRTLSIDRLTWSHAPFNGVLTALASILLLMALVGGDASTAVPISQLSFVVAAVLALMVFKELLSLRKIVGILAAIAAVVVLSTTYSLF
jgi:transporter family protein